MKKRSILTFTLLMALLALILYLFWGIIRGQSSAAETPAPSAKGNTSGWVLPEIAAPRVRRLVFDSKAVKTKVSCFLYTPEIYDTENERRFPVLYWLHGTGGGVKGIAPLSAFFDRAISEGKLPPMLVVFPNGLASSMWCDSKDGTVPMETVVVKELLPHIDATLRTIAKREGRIIEGFSMGGYGAARLGFKYADLFATVSILAGGPLDLEFKGPRATGNPSERERILQATYGGDMEYFKTQSPWMIAQRNVERVREKAHVRVVVGAKDFTVELNRKFAGHLQQLGVPHAFTEVPDVSHSAMPLLNLLGEMNWEFYRKALGPSVVEKL